MSSINVKQWGKVCALILGCASHPEKEGQGMSQIEDSATAGGFIMIWYLESVGGVLKRDSLFDCPYDTCE